MIISNNRTRSKESHAQLGLEPYSRKGNSLHRYRVSQAVFPTFRSKTTPITEEIFLSLLLIAKSNKKCEYKRNNERLDKRRRTRAPTRSAENKTATSRYWKSPDSPTETILRPSAETMAPQAQLLIPRCCPYIEGRPARVRDSRTSMNNRYNVKTLTKNCDGEV